MEARVVIEKWYIIKKLCKENTWEGSVCSSSALLPTTSHGRAWSHYFERIGACASEVNEERKKKSCGLSAALTCRGLDATPRQKMEERKKSERFLPCLTRGRGARRLRDVIVIVFFLLPFISAGKSRCRGASQDSFQSLIRSQIEATWIVRTYRASLYVRKCYRWVPTSMRLFIINPISIDILNKLTRY